MQTLEQAYAQLGEQFASRHRVLAWYRQRSEELLEEISQLQGTPYHPAKYDESTDIMDLMPRLLGVRGETTDKDQIQILDDDQARQAAARLSVHCDRIQEQVSKAELEFSQVATNDEVSTALWETLHAVAAVGGDFIRLAVFSYATFTQMESEGICPSIETDTNDVNIPGITTADLRQNCLVYDIRWSNDRYSIEKLWGLPLDRSRDLLPGQVFSACFLDAQKVFKES